MHNFMIHNLLVKKEIGLAWEIIRIPFTWYYNPNSSYSNKDMTIRLSSNNKGIEICKVSLKYKQ